MTGQGNSGIERFVNDAPDTEISQLVRDLNSLEAGERTVAKLILQGRAIIEPLKEFLFRGKPSAVYQPRRWAVEALAGVGAKAALIEYLTWKKEIPDPAVRLGEQAVENAAARALAAWRTPEVFQTLSKIASPLPQLGLVEALGAFKRPEPIPYFIRALEDDMCRSAAEEALRKLGAVAMPALLEAATARAPSAEEEAPSSVLRRVSALNLLTELRLGSDVWLVLRPLLSDSHSEVVIAVSKVATKFGDSEDKLATVRRVLEILPSVPWFAQEEIEDCLVRVYPVGRAILEAETTRRDSMPGEQRVMDRALRVLLRVKRRLAAREHGTE